MFDPTIGQFISEDPIEFEAGDPNLRRYVGNGPTNATDPSGLEEEPQGKIDEADFRQAADRSGVPNELVELILTTARDTPIGPGRSGLPIGAHQICADWVFTCENRLDAALNQRYGTVATPGIMSRRYLVLDVPYGSQGNDHADIPWRNWILPTLLDFLQSGGPARHGSTNGLVNSYPARDPEQSRKDMLAQIHTVYKLNLKDGSVWYIDLGALQGVLAEGSTIDDLDSGTWHVTPSGSLPKGWTPTTKTVQPSWEPRED